MDELTEFVASVWIVLDYPLVKIGKSSITLWAILLNLILILSFVIIISKLKEMLLATVTKRRGENASNWRATITLSYYALIGIGLVGILQTTGLDLSFFTVLTGAIGIGVGFGMQTIFSNFVSGIIILLEKPLKLGDRIEVGSIAGNVQNISVRATTIVTNDNVSIIVPNSDFISKQVINWSHSGNRVRVTISVPVSYDCDPIFVEKLLLQVAENEPGALKVPAPKVHLTEFADSGLKFSLLIWTQEYTDRLGVIKSLLNFGVLKIFNENKIRIPYPQREIHVLNEKSTKETPLWF
jgi:small-conductance mechanosensitive channel